MDFVSKLGAIVNQQAAEWKMVHEVETKYPNVVRVSAESCRRGLTHWGMVSLVATCFAAMGISEGLWTVDVAQEDLLLLIFKIMIGVWCFQILLSLSFKRFADWRYVGYLVGNCLGFFVFVCHLDDLLLFTLSSVFGYLFGLFTVWGGCVCMEYFFGPMSAFVREGAQKG